MVRVEFITYVSGGKAVRIKVPNRITLPITSKGYVPAELRVRPTKVSPLTKYQKTRKKKRMITHKCKCSSCQQVVSEWIGDRCMSCYNRSITLPLVRLHNQNLLRESTEHYKIENRLREVDLENNRFWLSLVEQYHSRLEVRMVDAMKSYAWKTYQFFWAFMDSIRFFFLGGGYRNLLTWEKK